jgi:O-antigen ligase
MSRLVEGSLILGIAFAVLAFGGTEPASFALVEVLLLGGSALLVANPRTVTHSVSTKVLVVPAAIVTVILVQLCPLPVHLLERLAGRENPATSVQLTPLSIEPYSTRTHLLIVLACVAAFYLTQIVSHGRKSKQRLIFSLIALGCFEAFYGLFQYLTGWQTIFTYVKKYDLAEATGTYINRNHYAGFLEMVLPFSLALAFYEYVNLGQNQHQPSSMMRKMITRASFQRMIFWLSITVVLFTGIVFSRSRMGIVAGCLSLLAIFGLAGVSRFRVRMLLPLSAAFLILSFSLALWIGPGPIAERFQSVGQEYSLGDQSRLSIWRDDLRLIRHHPWLGTGLGTFPIAFTTVQTTFLGQFVNHAHNDYLEFASDLGIPAALVLFPSVLFVLARAVRTFLLAEGNFERMIALGCTGSIVAMTLHAMADFNLYIPANALVFSTTLGLAMSAPPPLTRVHGRNLLPWP